MRKKKHYVMGEDNIRYLSVNGVVMKKQKPSEGEGKKIN